MKDASERPLSVRERKRRETSARIIEKGLKMFVKNGYDLKKLLKGILNSRTYQLSARTNELNAEDGIYFSHALTKLLSAEVLLDAISTVTATTTPFDGLPKGARATQIPDGKMENPFLKTFGRPARELACECERESDSNLSLDDRDSAASRRPPSLRPSSSDSAQPTECSVDQPSWFQPRSHPSPQQGSRPVAGRPVQRTASTNCLSASRSCIEKGKSTP